MKNIPLKIAQFFIITALIFGCKANDTNPTTTKIFGKGFKKNSPKSLEAVPEADIDEDSGVLPTSFALDGPPIINQGETSKCVAFSGAYYIIGMYNGVTSASQNFDKAGSAEFAYAYYKKINNDTDCNEGAFLFDEGNGDGMAEILRTAGTCSWNQLPFVESTSCTITNNTHLNQAANNKIADYARLDKSEYNDTQELKSWLYAGFPLWFAAPVDEGFQDLTTEVWKKPIGKADGSHAMTIIGWDDAKKAFKIANSWGKTWGDNGYGWVDYNYLTKLLSETETIGVLYPNDNQRAVFNQLSPGSCGRANWGDLFIQNNKAQEIAVEMIGKNYTNDNAGNIDANEQESYSNIPTGAIKVKIYTANKSTLLKEYDITVLQCDEVLITVN
jgi:Papain family cysteine protease